MWSLSTTAPPWFSEFSLSLSHYHFTMQTQPWPYTLWLDLRRDKGVKAHFPALTGARTPPLQGGLPSALQGSQFAYANGPLWPRPRPHPAAALRPPGPGAQLFQPWGRAFPAPGAGRRQGSDLVSITGCVFSVPVFQTCLA